MRRLGWVVAAKSVVVAGTALIVAGIVGPVPAIAGSVPAKAPAPSPSSQTAAEPGSGQTMCTVADRSLGELSGLVAIDNGYLAINDSNDNASAMRIFRLDNQCKLTSNTQYPSGSPARDPEDLGTASDGTVWVADVGDNDAQRTTVALWKLAPNSRTPVLHRVTYPDGAHDAEAVLIGGDGVPIIVTKSLGRPAGIYVPTAALVANSQNGVPLKKVGEFSPPASDTPGGIGPSGRLVVTGGATSPDGKKVVLRTYNDAFEWDVPDGDVAKAITGGKPRPTPLPNEPQGEAITYSRDGASFVTVSDVAPGKATPLLRYTPAAAPPVAPSKSNGSVSNASDSGPSSLTLDDIMYLIAGLGLIGLLLVIIGVIAIRRSRRRAAKRIASGDVDGSGGPRAGGGGGGRGGPRAGPGGPPHAAAGMPGRGMGDDDELDDLLPPKARGGRDQRGAVYGGPAGGRGDTRGGPGQGADRRGSEPRGGAWFGGDPRGGVEAGPTAGPVSPAEPPTAGGTYRSSGRPGGPSGRSGGPSGRSGGPSGRSGGGAYGARRGDRAEPPEYPPPYRDENRGRRP